MGEVQANPTVANPDPEVLQLLQDLDAQDEQRRCKLADKRTNPRKSCRTTCKLNYLSSDGAHLQTTYGTTRDLSTGGISFVSTEHFPRKHALAVTVSLSDKKARLFTGRVVYSRSAKEGWYLTGVKFDPVDVAELTPTTHRETSPRASPAGSGGEQDSTLRSRGPGATAGKREKALAWLAAVQTSRINSKDTVNKICALSMSPDHAVRRATIPVLRQIPRHNAISVLVQMLRDTNSGIQCDASDTLGQYGATEVIAPLKDLLGDSQGEVALHTAEALGRMGCDDGLRVVMHFLNGKTELNRRAAVALGVIMGTAFRPNSKGVDAARNYAKAKGIK